MFAISVVMGGLCICSKAGKKEQVEGDCGLKSKNIINRVDYSELDYSEEERMDF